MHPQPDFIEALENRRLLSVSIGSIDVTPLATHPAPRVTARGEKVRLTAQSIPPSPDDAVRSVTYFVDVDADGSLDGTDILIGRSQRPANHFAVTAFLRRAWAPAGDAVEVSAVPLGLQGPTDFGPAATQSVTLPPGAAKGASPTGSPTHTLDAKTLKRLARDEAPSADASELAGLEFEQETNALEGGASLPDADQGVLSAPPPPTSNAQG